MFNDILKDYERVADHSSNLAVAMIELDSNSFDELYEAYSSKYSV